MKTFCIKKGTIFSCFLMILLTVSLLAFSVSAESNVKYIENNSGRGEEFEFLGMGFNALADHEENKITKNTLVPRAIIDYNKIEALIMYGQSTISTGASADSTEKMMFNMGMDSTTSAGVSFPIKIFQIGFENKFSVGTSSSYSAFTKSSYYYYVSETVSEKYVINLSPLRLGSSDILSQNFIKAVETLNANPSTKQAAKFFENWGTHMLIGYNKGAYLEFYAHAHTKSLDKTFEYNFSNEFGASVGVGEKLKISAANSISQEFSMASSSSMDEYYSNWEAWGGDTTIGVSLKNDPEKNQEKIDDWAKTINDKNKVVIPRTTEWIAIWELIPSSYGDAAQCLQEYYISVAQEKNLEFFDKFTSYSNAVGTVVTYTSPTGYISNISYVEGSEGDEKGFKVSSGSKFNIASPDTDFNSISFGVEVVPKENSRYISVNDYGVVSVGNPSGVDLTETIIYVYAQKRSGDEITTSRKNFVVVNEGNGQFEGGYGTAQRPYLIKTPEQFARIRNNPSAYYRLVGDVDFSKISSYEIISAFSGALDGNGFTLKNWKYVQSTGGSIGLFGRNSGTIKNLTIDNFIISTKDGAHGELQVGFVCGNNSGTISNVVIRNSSMSVDMGSIDTDSDSGVKAGGICGASGGTIEKCGFSDSTIIAYSGSGRNSGTANCWVGGIVGNAHGKSTTIDCYSHNNTIKGIAKGTVSGWLIKRGSCGWSNVGGVIGRTEAESVKVVRCLGYGNFIVTEAEGRDYDRNGGSLIGYIYGGKVTLSDCYSESGDTLFGEGGNSGAKKYSRGLTAKNAIGDLNGFMTNGWAQSSEGGHLYIAQGTTLQIQGGKREYFEGNSLNISNLTVYLVKDDGAKSRELVNSGYTVSGYNPSFVGEQTITLTYGNGIKGSYTVTVIKPQMSGITVQTLPYRTTYFEGEKFDYNGLTVVASYTDGTTSTIELSALTVNGTSDIGQNTIKVQYKEFVTEFTVEVYEILPSYIRIETMPTKRNFKSGENFDSNGTSIYVRYNNGSYKTLTEGFDIDYGVYTECQSKGSKAEGTCVIIVSYEEDGVKCETSYTVVVGYVTEIEIIKTPTKYSYYTSDRKVDLSGIIVKAKYSNGLTDDVTDTTKMKVSGFNNTLAEKQDITVEYENSKAEYEIQVEDVKLTSIKIVEMPRTEFFVGETVTSTDLYMVLMAYYNDGSSKEIYEGYEVSFPGYSETVGVKWETTGTIKPTVHYTENGIRRDTSYDINKKMNEVIELQVTVKPDKTIYKPGEELDTDGMVVKMVRNDGSSNDVVDFSDCRIDYDFSKSGFQTVTVWHNYRSASFDVLVLSIDYITIEKLPTKTVYEQGESIDLTGMIIQEHYSNGYPENVENFECTSDVTVFEQLGNVFVTIKYGNHNSSFYVTVVEPDLSKKPHLSMEEMWARPGDLIQVKVNLVNNPGITSLRAMIDYEDNKLSLVNVSYSAEMAGTGTPPKNYETACSPLTLYWVDNYQDFNGDTVFATLTFEVKEDVLPGDMSGLSVSYISEDIFNIKGEEIDFLTTEGLIYILNYVPGDINDDGTLNSRDVTRIMQYFANWDVEVNETAMDIDGNGAIGTKDTTRLMQYLAGWDVELCYEVVDAQYLVFDANGGSVDEKLRTVNIGTELGELPVPERMHYAFEGWYDDDLKMTADMLMPDTFRIDLIARWNPNVYTVSLNNNSADVAGTEALYEIYGESFKDSLKSENGIAEITIPKRIGYTFGGYYIDEEAFIDENGTIVVDALCFEEDTELIAKWYKNTTITLNNGEKAESTEVYLKATDRSCYSDIELAAKIDTIKVPAAPGYTFNGYYLETSGEKVFYVGADGQLLGGFNSLDDVSLYAEWKTNTYKVVYDANGGNGYTKESHHMYDEESALSENTFVNTQKIFVEWNTYPDGSGTSYADGEEVKNLTDKDGGTVILYAQWKPFAYTVIYDANGGSGEMEASAHDYNEAKALNANAYSKIGYTFAGWNTNADGSGVAYPDGEEIVNLTSENGAVVTLYAQWQNNIYTVVYYDGYSSSILNSSEHTYGVTKALVLNSHEREGYTFVGWNTEADGSGIAYSDGEEITNITSENEAEIPFYAQWNANSYTVAFNGNGATSGSMSDQLREYDDGKILTANAYSKTGYTFASWNTSADGSGITFADKTTANITADDGETITLYAQWGNRPYTVVFNGNGATSGSMSDQLREYDDGKALTGNEYTKAGYAFIGWNTKSDGSGDSFEDKAVANLTTDTGATIMLYAQWGPVLWKDNSKLPEVSGDYILDTDVTISDTWGVPSGTTNLCLNGHTIRYTGNAYIMYLDSTVEFNITDSKDNGMLVAESDAEYTGEAFCGIWLNGGKLTMDSGKLYVKNTLSRANVRGIVARGNSYLSVSGDTVIESYGSGAPFGLCTGSNSIINISGNAYIYSENIDPSARDGRVRAVYGETGAVINISGSPTIKAYSPSATNTVNALRLNASTVNFNGTPTLIAITESGIASEIHCEKETDVISVNCSLENDTPYRIYKVGGVFTQSEETTYNDASKFSSSIEGYKIEQGTDGQLYIVGVSYIVAFNGNGATSGSMSNQSRAYDDGKALTANAFKRAYTVAYNYNGSGTSNTSAAATYTFNGWATSASGSVAYADKATANIATSGTVTLYAKWTSASVTLPTLTRTGYTFGGWYKEAACTNKVGDGGASYTPAANITLYAKWTANTYTVKYNANGGSGSMSSSTHTYDSSKSLTSNAFNRTDYTFLGWSTSSSAMTPTYTNGQSVKNLTSTNGGTVNLYAVWVKTSGSYGYYSRELEVWHDSVRYDLFDIGFDRAALIANGYTEIDIELRIDGWENWMFHDCKPVIYIYNFAGGKLIEYTGQEFTCNIFGGDWKTQNYSFEVDLTAIRDDGTIQIGYCAVEYPNTEGTQSAWHLGTAEVKVTAVKYGNSSSFEEFEW